MRYSPLTAILLAGFIAGTIDIVAAILINGLNPIIICQAIASGAIGKASFHGGLQTAGLGLVLQWAMSIIIAGIYIVAAQVMPALRRAWLGFGLLYGVGIYFVMTFVVVPLSAAHGKGYHFVPVKFAEDMVAMLVFGTIVAWFARGTTPAEHR
jgi:uncharacterized membrane protein YagU involved in acid resistance